MKRFITMILKIIMMIEDKRSNCDDIVLKYETVHYNDTQYYYVDRG